MDTGFASAFWPLWIMLSFFFFLKVSCLCLEENVENDPCKFALTSRTGDVVETFILHSSSPSVRQTWIHEINQILENQRNFLNGNVCGYFPKCTHFYFSSLSCHIRTVVTGLSEQLLWTRHYTKHYPPSASFIFPMTWSGKSWYYSHFIDGEAEAQSGFVICSRSHMLLVAEWGHRAAIRLLAVSPLPLSGSFCPTVSHSMYAPEPILGKECVRKTKAAGRIGQRCWRHSCVQL